MEQKNMKSSPISRREMIRLMGLGGLGAIAAACGAAATPETIIQTVEVEKVVEKEVAVETIVTATPEGVPNFSGANLEAIMRNSFIPAMNQLQQNQYQIWADSRSAGVEAAFSREWRELIAAAVDSGAGGDIGELFANQAFIYGDRLADVSDICEELGEQYGGWYDLARESAVVDGVWRAIPRAYTASAINYRTDVFEEAGDHHAADHL